MLAKHKIIILSIPYILFIRTKPWLSPKTDFSGTNFHFLKTQSLLRAMTKNIFIHKEHEKNCQKSKLGALEGTNKWTFKSSSTLGGLTAPSDFLADWFGR